jgi:hypothetical protein
VTASRSRNRPSIALTALLCLAAQALGLAHLALVRHATCLEHAEFVHAPEITARAVAQPAADPITEVDAQLALEGHEDDHCLVAASRRRDLAALDASAGQTWTTVAPPALRHVIETEAPAPPVPLLALAPKSSPPALV